MKTIKIYNTLAATSIKTSLNEYDDWDEDPMKFKHELDAALSLENKEGDLADYIDKLKNRLFHIEIGTMIFKDRLYGEATCTVSDDWTDEEMEILKDYLTIQYADGWGEGFEQREITTFEKEEDIEYIDKNGKTCHKTKTIRTDVYIHFWQVEGYRIMTEEEFKA